MYYRWTDGTVVNYANWWTNEPNNDDGSEGCAFMFGFNKPGGKTTPNFVSDTLT